MFLTPQDFTGKHELHTGLYDQSKLQDYIDRYEKKYLIEMFGATLFDDFIADLDVNNVPQSPNFIQIFGDFHLNVSLHELLISEGVLEMLKGFIYFEYSKDQMNQQTPFGNVTQLSENSKKVTTLNSMIYTRYNEAVKTYNAIQKFMILNLNDLFVVGQVVKLVVINVGVNPVGTYNNLIVFGGQGTGLTINFIKTSLTEGYAVILTKGKGYLNTDSLFVAGNVTFTPQIATGDFMKFNGINKLFAYWI